MYFYGKRMLASPIVNQIGQFLRGQTGADNRLPTIVTEVLRAMLYVDLYEPPETDTSDRAAALASWQREMQRRGRFPTGEMEDYLRKSMPNAPNLPVLRRRPRKRLRR